MIILDDLSKQPEELFKFLDSLNYDNKKSPLNNNGDNENINYQDKTENFNQGIIRKGLLPQLKKNEKQKRSLKPKLMQHIISLILVHSIIMLILLALLVCSVTVNCSFFKNISIDALKELSKFMMFFITASLAEFIGMLLVIVHYIFDKSIVDLMKEFNSKNNLQKDKNKKDNYNTNKLNSIEDNLSYTKKLQNNFDDYKNDVSMFSNNSIDDKNDKDNTGVI